jgi:hypothetical protein
MGYPNTAFKGRMEGTDLRWNTPLSGLMLGASYAGIDDKYKFIDMVNGPTPVAGTLDSTSMFIVSEYGEYSWRRWRFDAENRRNMAKYWQVDPDPGQTDAWWYSDRGCFASVAYRISKHLEAGTYHSRYHFDQPTVPDPTTHYIHDTAVTLKYTVTRFWDVKVEEHFMHGTGDVWSSHGFYAIDNPQGLRPSTDMLVLRTGFNL